MTKIIWNWYENPNYTAKQRCSSTSRKGGAENLCRHHVFSVRGERTKQGVDIALLYSNSHTWGILHREKTRAGGRAVTQCSIEMGFSQLLTTASWQWNGFTWASPTCCLWLAGWEGAAAPPMSNFPVLLSSQLDWPTAVEDMRTTEKESEWPQHPVIAKGQTDLFTSSVYYLFARPHHLHSGTAQVRAGLTVHSVEAESWHLKVFSHSSMKMHPRDS